MKVRLPISKSIANRLLLLQAIHGDPLMRVSSDMPDDVIVLHDALQQIRDIFGTPEAYASSPSSPLHGGTEGGLTILPFLSDMPERYANADLVISRAGASSISELCLLGKPAILVPSPNVAEDHQTHNAMALVDKDAAVLVRDSDAMIKLIPAALALIRDEHRLTTLHNNILTLAQHDSARRIAEAVIKLARKNE